jgi:5-methylcytosine-specific restriction endonuclease McrA
MTQDSQKIRGSTEDNQWKRKVKERDGKCRACGASLNLQVHHIKPLEKYRTLLLNLIMASYSVGTATRV